MIRRLLPLALVGVLLTGCGGYDETVVPSPSAETEAAPAAPSDCVDNNVDERRSYDPADGTLDGAAVERIRSKGRLVAGVAADTYLLAARNAESGQIEGFDIDMVYAVAAAIFDDFNPKKPQSRVELKVITAADRFNFLEQGLVDIVVRNTTVNCARWQRVAFSQIYYDAGQKVLVGVDPDNQITTIDQLAGKRICAPAGTTSIDNIQKIQPKAIPVASTDNSACMILFQNGEADGVSTDDTVLAGLAAQDPYATVLDTPFLTNEPYGIGTNSADDDLVRLINKTLEDMRRDGRWQASYDKWLAPELGPKGVQPPALYGR